MASTTIKQLEIRSELTWAEIDGSLGQPVSDTTLTNWETVEFLDASQVTVLGEAIQDPGTAARAGFYQNPPSPVLTSQNIPIKSGTMTIDFYLRSTGNYTFDGGLRKLFATRMDHADNVGSSATEITSVTSSTDGSTLALDDPTAVAAGDMVMCFPTNGGVTHYAHVMTASPDPVLVTPALPASFTAGYCLKISEWSVPAAGGDPVYNGISSPSVTIRATGDGWKSVAYGCTLTNLTITGSGEDGRPIKCTATIDLPFVIDTLGSYVPAPVTDVHGIIEHSLGSPLAVGVAKSVSAMTTADDEGDAQDSNISGACTDEWTLTLNWTCDQMTCGSTYLGRGPLEASDLELTLQTTLARAAAGVNSTNTLISTIRSQWEQSQLRTIVLGFDSKEIDDGTNFGTGGCIAILAAGVQDSSFLTIDEGKGFQRVAVTWTAGPYGRHSTSSNNKLFALALN